MRKPVLIICLFITSVIACKKEDKAKPTPTPTPTQGLTAIDSLAGTYIGINWRMHSYLDTSNTVRIDTILSFIDTISVTKLSDSSFKIHKSWGGTDTSFTIFKHNASNTYTGQYYDCGISFTFPSSADSLLLSEGCVAASSSGGGFSSDYNHYYGKKQ